MWPIETSSPTPDPDQALPRPAPWWRNSSGLALVRVAGAAVVVGGAVAGLQAGGRVRRMRADATTVRPLDHDVDLPGRFPPRWVVVLGDSAAAGHGLVHADGALPRRIGRGLVAADGRATAVRCVAIDGATTSDVLAGQLEVARDAEVVVIGVGVNDATCHRQSIARSAATLRTLLTEVRGRAATGARIVLLTCPDLSAAPGIPAVLRSVVGARCRALARAQALVAADLGVVVVGADRARLSPEVFGPDGFHPGALGHELLAAEVIARLAVG